MCLLQSILCAKNVFLLFLVVYGFGRAIAFLAWYMSFYSNFASQAGALAWAWLELY